MKKIILTIVVAIALFLNGTIDAMASTLHCESKANGEVEIKLSTDTGYLNALDVTIELSGDVKLEQINWDESLASEYVKKYTYQDNIIRIYIATGDASKNLVSSDGTVHIGILKVKADKDNTLYDVKINKLNVSNMNYQASEESDVSTIEHQEFVYNTTPIVDDDKDDNQNPSTDQDKTPSNPSGNLPGGEQKPSNDSNHSNANQDEDDEKDNDSTIKPGDDSSNVNKPSTDDKKDDQYSNTVEEDEKTGVFPMVIGGTLAVVIIGGVIFYLCKKI